MIPHNHIFLMWSSCIYEWKIKLFTILALRFCFYSLLTTQLFIEPHVCLHRLLNLRILSQHSDSWCWYEFFLLKHFGCDHGHLYSNSNIGKENQLRIVWNPFLIFFHTTHYHRKVQTSDDVSCYLHFDEYSSEYWMIWIVMLW